MTIEDEMRQADEAAKEAKEVAAKEAENAEAGARTVLTGVADKLREKGYAPTIDPYSPLACTVSLDPKEGALEIVYSAAPGWKVSVHRGYGPDPVTKSAGERSSKPVALPELTYEGGEWLGPCESDGGKPKALEVILKAALDALTEAGAVPKPLPEDTWKPLT